MLFLFLATSLLSDPVTPQAVTTVRNGAPLIRDKLDGALFDYPSARFRNVWITINRHTPDLEGPFVCGLINSKNRSGGYTGWQPFAASPARGGELYILGSPGVDYQVAVACDPAHATFDTTDRSSWFTYR